MTIGKEDTAKELQNHTAKTQDTWIAAVENTEVTEIEHAVCRALNQLRAATTKGLDIKRRTIRLERVTMNRLLKSGMSVLTHRHMTEVKRVVAQSDVVRIQNIGQTTAECQLMVWPSRKSQLQAEVSSDRGECSRRHRGAYLVVAH